MISSNPAPDRLRASPLSRDERRDAIAAATVPLLVEHGATITTRQIADAAGVAEGTLFRAFADKEEILRAAVVRSLDPAPAVRAIGELPDEGLRPLVVHVVDFLLEAQLVGMRVFAAAHQVLDPSHRPSPAKHRDERGRASSALIDAIEHRLAAHGDELRVAPSVAAHALFALTFGNGMPHVTGGDRLGGAQLVDLVLGGIAVPTGAGDPSDPSP
ncbi:TetR/AcrR family transcriptional regulator [Cellulosimicrobium terreum]|nr:TetR/AcrR family transcriptional regulator [Cellulosimicrobium terreum]